jgi:hypothetical protein
MESKCKKCETLEQTQTLPVADGSGDNCDTKDKKKEESKRKNTGLSQFSPTKN